MVRPHQQTPQKQQPMETESQGKELGTGGVGGRVSNSLIHGNSTGLERTDRNFRHSQSQANTGKTAHLRTQQLNKLPARDKAMTEGHSRTKWLTPGRGKPRAAADCLWQNHEGHEGRGASFEHCVQTVWIPVRNGLGRLTTFQMHDRVSRRRPHCRNTEGAGQRRPDLCRTMKHAVMTREKDVFPCHGGTAAPPREARDVAHTPQ